MLARLVVVAAAVTVAVAPSAGARAHGSATTCSGAVSWSTAARYAGHVVTVKGPVVGAVYASASNGRPTFLNVGRPYPNPRRFTVVIWGRNRSAFGAPEQRFRGRTICVRGLVELYLGSAEIQVRSPSQIALG